MADEYDYFSSEETETRPARREGGRHATNNTRERSVPRQRESSRVRTGSRRNGFSEQEDDYEWEEAPRRRRTSSLHRTMGDSRNATIDLWKFIYSWFVVLYHYLQHSKPFTSGKYAVEFFLIVAGVFFFMGFEKKDREGTAAVGPYVGKRFARLFPWALTGFIFAFVVKRMVIGSIGSMGELADYLSKDIWEILLVKMNGFNQGNPLLNDPAWTLSAMFLVEIVMIGFLCSNKKNFVNVVLPITLIIGYGFWRNTEMGNVADWIGFTTLGVLRAWLAYGCAYYCFRLSEYMKKISYSGFGRLCLTVIEALLHLFAIYTMMYKATRYWQWCATLAFVGAVAISISGQSLWNAILGKLSGLTSFLSGLSLSIYLIHYPIYEYFKQIYTKKAALFSHVWSFIIVTLVFSLLHYFVTKGIISLWRILCPRVRSLLIEEGPEEVHGI